MKKRIKGIAAVLLSSTLAISTVNHSMPILAMDVSAYTTHQIIDQKELVVAPEVTYSWYDMTVDGYKQKVHTIEFDLNNNENLELQVATSNGYVYGLQDVSSAIQANDAEGNRVIAGVNGDFYNMRNGIPVGVFINDGEILVSPPTDWSAFGIKGDNSVVTGYSPVLTSELTYFGKTVPIEHINRIRDASEENIVLFTPSFYSSTMTDNNRDEYIATITYGDDEVRTGENMVFEITEIRKNTGNSPLKEGQVVLSVTGKYREILGELEVGDPLLATFQLDEAWEEVEMAIGGEEFVLKDDVVLPGSNTARHPRTALGVKENGEIVLIEIDGRSSGYSEGVTLKQLGEIMKSLGCTDALNLDGGGSATMLVRMPGEFEKTLVNQPSDGGLRRVANSLLLIDDSLEGEASQFIVKPYEVKVLGGSEYPFSYTAIDDNYHLAEFGGTVTWDVADSDYGIFDDQGIITTNKKEGTTQVIVSSGEMKGEGTLEVITNLTSLKMTGGKSSIESGGTLDLSVVGYQNGQTVIATDKAFDWYVEGNIGTIDEEGVFRATHASNQRGKIIVEYENPVTSEVVRDTLDIIVGRPPELIEDFEDGVVDWLATGVNYESVIVSEATDSKYVKSGMKSLRLDYDFSNTTGTSGAYVAANTMIELPDAPTKIGMWVYGDGQGHWLRSQIRDGNNRAVNIDFVPIEKGIDFEGWQYVEATVPSGLTMPLKLEYPVRYMSTDDENKTAGTLYIDDITAIYGEAKGETSFAITPFKDIVGLEDNFLMNINIQSPTYFESGEMVLEFDPERVEAKAIVRGYKLEKDNFKYTIDNEVGEIHISLKDMNQLSLQDKDIMASLLFKGKTAIGAATLIQVTSGYVTYTMAPEEEEPIEHAPIIIQMME